MVLLGFKVRVYWVARFTDSAAISSRYCLFGAVLLLLLLKAFHDFLFYTEALDHIFCPCHESNFVIAVCNMLIVENQ